MASDASQRTRSRRPRGGLRARLLVGLIVGMLAFPAFAAAQGSSPTRDQYKDIPACLDCGDPDGGLGGDVGPLPFTGFDVIAMVAVALGVTGIGLALQRAVARESQ